MAWMVENLPVMQETHLPSPGQEDPLEKGMATHGLPGESHGQRSLVAYSPRGHAELDTAEKAYTADKNTPSCTPTIWHCLYTHTFQQKLSPFEYFPLPTPRASA